MVIPGPWRPGPTGYGPVMASSSSKRWLLWTPRRMERVWPPFEARGPLASGRTRRRRRPASRRRASRDSRRPKERLGRRIWPGSLLACVSLTGILERRPGSVSSPVLGRETRPPGVCKRRHPWPPSSPGGRADWQQISGGFWCFFQHHPSPLFSSVFWSSSQGPFWFLDLLLG